MQKSGKGFLTFAENTDTVDYLSMAYLQARWLKKFNPTAQYAVVINSLAENLVTDKHRDIFDHIITIQTDWNNENSQWKLQNESQVFELTPFKETIKIEADLLIHTNVNHWWDALRLRDVVLSVGSVNYFGETNTSKRYREFFVINDLPDVYNGLMYFRYSETAYQFFETAKTIRENWKEISTTILKKCYETEPSTDTLYAITSRVFGEERVTIPTMTFFRMCHMKASHNKFPEGTHWWESLLFETDGNLIRINNIRQYYPLHYQNKEFIKFYERNYKELI